MEFVLATIVNRLWIFQDIVHIVKLIIVSFVIMAPSVINAKGHGKITMEVATAMKQEPSCSRTALANSVQ